MTPTQRQAMEQALEALESLFGIGDYYTGAGAGGVAVWREGGSAPVEAAMAALRAALAETAEPVAWTFGPSEWKDWCSQYFGPDADDDYLAKAVFDLPVAAQRFRRTAPQPPAPAVEMTDEEIKELALEAFSCRWDADDETLVNKYEHGVYLWRFIDFARAAIAAHEAKKQKGQA